MKNKIILLRTGIQLGFTLVELIVTIAVLAILLAIAIPNFQVFIVNGRMTSAANDMMTTLGFARSEAIKRAANITVCASSSGSACSGGTWENGWIVLDAGGNVIRVREALEGAATLTGASTIIISANGRMTSPAVATTLTLNSGVTGIDGRQIQIDPSGRARVCKPSC